MPRGLRGSVANPAGKTRIQLDLHPKNRAQLEWLLANTDAASYSEVCRRALELLHAARTAKDEGKEFGVYDNSAQTFVQVIVL